MTLQVFPAVAKRLANLSTAIGYFEFALKRECDSLESPKGKQTAVEK
jgi:hypothetical protein